MAWKDKLLRTFCEVLCDVRSLEKTVKATQEDINNLKTKVQGMESAIAEIAEDVGALSTGLTNVLGTITTLQQQIKDLQDSGVDVGDLTSTIDGALAEVFNVRDSADALAKKLPVPEQPAPDVTV